MDDELKNNVAENPKDEVFYKVCNSVLKFEVYKGHKAWTISAVAKDARITRSLIYYYFGKEKEVILKEAWRFMLDLILSLSDGNQEFGANERIKEASEKINMMPYLFVLFFLQKNDDSEIGELIREGEARLLRRLEVRYPNLSKEEILKFYILELGIVSYRNLNNEQIDTFLKKV